MCFSSSDKLSNSSRDDMAATRPKETPRLKIEREGKRRSSSRSQGRATAQTANAEKKPNTSQDDAACAALDKDYFRAENELPVENKQKMVVANNFLLIDF
jgi:translation initiation factor 2 beta subunit (eIF-2beta)/eIF-5